MGSAIFYVGKGQGDRIHAHELEAMGLLESCNLYKVAAIKAIWAKGEQAVKEVVAYFDNEIDAYMYEWALINMTCYAEQLTNIARIGMRPTRRVKPFTSGGICIARGNRVFHHVHDLDVFRARHGFSKHEFSALIDGKVPAIRNWQVVQDCAI